MAALAQQSSRAKLTCLNTSAKAPLPINSTCRYRRSLSRPTSSGACDIAERPTGDPKLGALCRPLLDRGKMWSNHECDSCRKAAICSNEPGRVVLLL
jgi:hypothetical protein